MCFNVYNFGIDDTLILKGHMISFQVSSTVVRPAVSATAVMAAFILMMRGDKVHHGNQWFDSCACFPILCGCKGEM